jgi:flagellar basal-body rod modification protein FlgD
MTVNSINNYSASGVGNATTTGKTKDNSTLSMDDFFTLMVAQLKNQDMYNTTDNMEFISQMAQFSMVQALADLSELSMTNYGVSLIGKEVTLASIDEDGNMTSYKGIVDSVNFFNGSTQVVVDGKNYALSNVMAVQEPNIIIPNFPEKSAAAPESNNDSTADSGSDGEEPVNIEE